MPIVKDIPGVFEYYLINHDDNGKEFPDTDAGSSELLSRVVKERIAGKANPVTDLFIVSHGWAADERGAKDQYLNWFKTMGACDADIVAMQSKRDGAFKPLIVGLHWPSIINADESLYKEFQTRAATGTGALSKNLVKRQAERFSKDSNVQNAYADVLAAIAEMEPSHHAGTRDMRGLLFSWDELQTAIPASLNKVEEHFGWPKNTVVNFLKSFAQKKDTHISAAEAFAQGTSFWTMRDRARQFGHGALNPFLRDIKALITKPRELRIHLVGHSFGCVVVSAGIHGGAADGRDSIEIDSLNLLQGALSAYAYCKNNPGRKGHQGEYNLVVSKVKGPIISTQSKYDIAVGTWYPIAARLAEIGEITTTISVDIYGALGRYGAQGEGIVTEPMDMLSATTAYNFKPGAFHNVNSDKYICESLDIKSGAHCDLAHPEVGHLVWQTALNTQPMLALDLA
jgi:hypothetical protein